MLSCDWQFLHLNWTLEFWPPMGAATMTVYGQSIAVVIIHYSSQPVLVTQLTTASFDRLHAAACYNTRIESHATRRNTEVVELKS